ncbi:MAG: YceI family protein [Bacteroidales bacterium]|nr:YceI family protein [Bacteroidales bacterium]
MDNRASSIEIEGTSTLHDWVVVAEMAEGFATWQNSEATKAIKAGRLQVAVDALNSGKSSMDKVMKKALQESDHPKIVFTYSETITFVPIDSRNFHLRVSGDLTIAGETRQIQLDMKGSSREGHLKLEGEKALKMSDFNIEAPSAMFGTIKSGDKITVNFSVIFQ